MFVTGRGAGVEVADDGKGEASVKGVAILKAVASLELGCEPSAPLPHLVSRNAAHGSKRAPVRGPRPRGDARTEERESQIKEEWNK